MLRRVAVAILCLGSLANAAKAADHVEVGVLNAAGDLGVFIAEARGYFKAENLDVTLTPLDSAVKMMPSLGTGDLDVGSGASTAALYNAAARKIDVRVVASRGRTAPGYIYQTLVIRKDLVESGRYKGYADLKGLKFGFVAPGAGPASSLNEAAKKGGVDVHDIPIVYLNFAAQVAALQSKAIDGSIMIEPYAGQAVASGAAVSVTPTEDYYPGQEVSLLLYGDKFIKARPDVAKRFMKAFLRGTRDFNDVLLNGRWRTDGKSDDVIRIFAKAVNFPEAVIRGMTPQYADPDGRLNMESLRKDLAFFRMMGDVQDTKIQADDIVDLSFAANAARELGPYAPPTK